MIKKKLETFFEKTHTSEYMDYVVQTLSLMDSEIESITKERLQIIIGENNNVNIQEEKPEAS